MRLSLVVLLGGCGGMIEPAAELEALRHDVQYELEDGVARLEVHRAFRGIDTAELELDLPLPSGAAVDRFRYAIDDRWIDGQLLEATAAEERYDLLSGLAGLEGEAVEGAPPPALLAYDSSGHLKLRAHPIAPEDTVELEYRIVLPTCHEHGRALLDYPFDPSDPPSFFGPGIVRDLEETDDFGSACDPGSTILDGDRVVIELDPLEDVALTYAVQSLGERTAVRIAIDMPSELAPIPEAPTVVFVMDGSYSQADAGLADQLAWAKAYLAWVPDAEVEIVVVRREAERLFGRLVPAREFVDALAAVPAERLALANGSALELGLALADSIQGGGEKRIVAFSDLLLRESFDASEISLGAVTHLLEHRALDSTPPAISVDLSSEWAAIPAATGGVFARLYGDAKDASGEPMILAAEELVHPIRIDELQLTGLDDVVHDSFVDQATTMRITALLESRPPDRLQVEGKVWSAPISFDVAPSRSVDEAMPAILIATAPGISDDELRDLAFRGGVVSAVTSYLAERGGVDPLPPEAQIGEAYGIGGFGVSGIGCGCRCGGVIRGGEHHHWLIEQLGELARACGATGGEASAETTDDEIVDVSVTASSGEECLREAIWSLRLPKEYRQAGRTGAKISL